MDTFGTVIERHLRSLTGMLGDVPVERSATVVGSLSRDDLIAVIQGTTGAMAVLEGLRTVAAGAVERLSARETGHGGLAQQHGHRSATSLLQDLTGVSRAQAGKITRLGRDLLDTTGQADDSDPAQPTPAGEAQPDEPDDPAQLGAAHPAPPRPWHACLGDAFARGRISVDQQSAIRRGLGEPPRSGDAGADAGADDAWASAAEQLIDEASRRTVEDLGTAARSVRDHLDPEGAERRFQDQHERRSFRMWIDADGIRCAKIRFEAGGAALITSIRDAALRPRRGGPRFVDPAEKADAEALATDPRSNEQLEYDLFIDLVHAGALADTATVHGTRQAGVRVVVADTARDASRAGGAGVAVLDDTNTTVPAAFAAQRACDAGSVECVVDSDGNPLDLGREARLFSPRQRVALAIRDGGCGWPGCDKPASYCEAHHIDKYSEGGRTDLDRGILLCRFHHMNLHHHGWWISRDGTGPFVRHPPDPGVAPIVLRCRVERRYAFGDLQPPPTRFRPESPPRVAAA